MVSAGILVTAGIVEFAWEPMADDRVRVRFDGDRWREVPFTLDPGEDGRELLSEPGGGGFCGSDGPLVRAGPWSEN